LRKEISPLTALSGKGKQGKLEEKAQGTGNGAKRARTLLLVPHGMESKNSRVLKAELGGLAARVRTRNGTGGFNADDKKSKRKEADHVGCQGGTMKGERGWALKSPRTRKGWGQGAERRFTKPRKDGGTN